MKQIVLYTKQHVLFVEIKPGRWESSEIFITIRRIKARSRSAQISESNQRVVFYALWKKKKKANKDGMGTARLKRAFELLSNSSFRDAN